MSNNSKMFYTEWSILRDDDSWTVSLLDKEWAYGYAHAHDVPGYKKTIMRGKWKGVFTLRFEEMPPADFLRLVEAAKDDLLAEYIRMRRAEGHNVSVV